MKDEHKTHEDPQKELKRIAKERELDGLRMLGGKAYEVITRIQPPFPEVTYGEHMKKLKAYNWPLGPTNTGDLIARYGISVFLHRIYGYHNEDLDKIIGYSARFTL